MNRSRCAKLDVVQEVVNINCFWMLLPLGQCLGENKGKQEMVEMENAAFCLLNKMKQSTTASDDAKRCCELWPESD